MLSTFVDIFSPIIWGRVFVCRATRWPTEVIWDDDVRDIEKRWHRYSWQVFSRHVVKAGA